MVDVHTASRAHRPKDGTEALVVHAVVQREVDRVVLTLVRANVLDVARAGEVLSKLVEGCGHDAVRRVECLFHAVSVVDVDVDVQHALVVPVGGASAAGSRGC